MLAPEGAEVAAQEWDVLVVVVVEEAIGLLAAVDQGDDGFSVIVVVPSRWLGPKRIKDWICFFCSRYGPPVRTEHRLIVENLSSRISWQVRFL